MQDDSFGLLEKKVLTAVQRIQELKAENETLVARRNELESLMEALKARVDQAESQLAEARSQAAVVDEMEDKRKIIEEKVGGLLEKLDSIV